MTFEDMLTEAQPRLFAYLLKRIRRPDIAKDVLQEVNLVIWNKKHSFTEGTNFNSWSYTIAHFQLLKYLQKNKKSPLVFDNELIHSFNDQQYAEDGISNRRKTALQECMSQLSEENQLIINTRYSKTKSVIEIAHEIDKSPNAISKLLHRSRIFLLKCISKNLAEDKSL